MTPGPDPSRRGGRRPVAPPARPAPSRAWETRLDDPDEPLFTVAVACDLLATDAQSLRRLEQAVGRASSRPSGNQRRYSRHDLELLADAIELAREGFTPIAVARILSLERRIDEMSRPGGPQ